MLATVPRDHTYGILAIRPFVSEKEAVAADYSKTVREIFIEAMFSLILEMGLPVLNIPLMQCQRSQSNSLG